MDLRRASRRFGQRRQIFMKNMGEMRRGVGGGRTWVTLCACAAASMRAERAGEVDGGTSGLFVRAILVGVMGALCIGGGGREDSLASRRGVDRMLSLFAYVTNQHNVLENVTRSPFS